MRLNWKKEFVLKLAQTLVKSIKKLRLNKNLNWPLKLLQSVSIKEKILRKIKRFQKTLIKFKFKDEILNELEEDAQSEASFGRSENDISTLGPAFDKLHFQNYSESAMTIWPKTFDHKF